MVDANMDAGNGGQGGGADLVAAIRGLEERINEQFERISAILQPDTKAYTASAISGGDRAYLMQCLEVTQEAVSNISTYMNLPETQRDLVIPSFDWPLNDEKANCQLYTKHILDHFAAPNGYQCIGGDGTTLQYSFLDNRCFVTLTGKTDVLVSRVVAGGRIPFNSFVPVMFELKTQDSGDVNAACSQYQAEAQLILSDFRRQDNSDEKSPMVILTDLADYWYFLWFDRKLNHPQPPRKIKSFFTQCRQTAFQVCSYALQHAGVPYPLELRAQGSPSSDDSHQDLKPGNYVSTGEEDEEDRLADVMSFEEQRKYHLLRALHDVEGRFRRSVNIG